MQKHILLIDDDEDESDLFTLVLEKFPAIRFSYASSALKGLRMIENEQPDLVFLDVNMPVMDGLKCLAVLRERNDFATTPVLIYSTSDDPSMRVSALSLGAQDCLRKPSNLGALESMLRNVFERFLGS